MYNEGRRSLPMYDGRRRRLTPPMYDVRCTMYDGRWTTEAANAAYVRSTMYDGRLQSLRALRGDGGGENAAYVRSTMYDGRLQIELDFHYFSHTMSVPLFFLTRLWAWELLPALSTIRVNCGAVTQAGRMAL